MLRAAKRDLIAWKSRPSRLPLLLLGARQTGKTYLLEEFGREKFPVCHRFDFAEDPLLAALFESNLKPDRIVRDLSIYRDTDIDPYRDLIVFDEVQQCPQAITSLKYFAEKMSGAFIVASGSLLGIGLGDALFPVGKTERLHLYPMSFIEFLNGTGQGRLATTIEEASPSNPLSKPVHEKIWAHLKTYFIVGGLPGIINVYKEHLSDLRRAFVMTREAQARLISDYLFDISKHSGKTKAVRIEAVFKNVPISLAREIKGTKKFVFKDVLQSASRYSALEGPIEWLVQAGLVHKVAICKDAVSPLCTTANEKRFKLYLFDIGLLGAMVGLAPSVIHSYDYGSYKGYFAENYVLQELVAAHGVTLYSWNKNTSEIEFLWQREGEILPIEVKAGINTKAKSLGVYSARYNPPRTVLFSGRPMGSGLQDTKLSLPMYMASQLERLAK